MSFTHKRTLSARNLMSVLTAGALLISASACSSDSTSSEDQVEGSGHIDGDGKSIVAFMPSTATIYMKDWAESAKDEADALGYSLKIFESKADQSEQDQQVQQFLATGEDPAAFIWWPSNAKAGINSSRLLSQVAPVVQTNQDVLAEGRDYITAYAGVKAYGIGEAMGEMAIEARSEIDEPHSPEGNTLEFTFPAGYQSGIDRQKGFKAATKNEPFKILQSEPNAQGFDSQGTFKTASQVVPKYLNKGIDIVTAQNLSMAAGANTALEQNGLEPGKDVIVIAGNDAGDKTPLKDGSVYSAVIQSPVIEGKVSVQTVAKYIATGEVTDETVDLEVTDEEPELKVEPPAKTTYMPNPPIKADQIDDFKFWGLSYEQLGSQ
ncbi:sugar ABC transporter substrate-binding protein [Brevibacterium sp. UCMA 11754]|uniref:sugar ABC transporter substrate-binding protein n=1 Tax=Brevibacterium sp. UCMA 11754 TaxID=2749198 RepID=UPI001F2ABD3E|nr:sugar ABC transporter substrate-binding protein [Brevibacterium sp. UCMA 11754]MCF2571134.1 sugar ABC transporter substrate-binding protein [Brevibacterium sp. UCMA 11754]